MGVAAYGAVLALPVAVVVAAVSGLILIDRIGWIPLLGAPLVIGLGAGLGWWFAGLGADPPGGAGDARCRGCGYDLTANISGRCPECGTAIPPRQRRRLPGVEGV